MNSARMMCQRVAVLARTGHFPSLRRKYPGPLLRAAKVLNNLQVQPSEVRTLIEVAHPAGEQPTNKDQLGMTQQGKVSIELAVQEAQALSHHYIGTEHLLLGLLRE